MCQSQAEGGRRCNSHLAQAATSAAAHINAVITRTGGSANARVRSLDSATIRAVIAGGEVDERYSELGRFDQNKTASERDRDRQAQETLISAKKAVGQALNSARHARARIAPGDENAEPYANANEHPVSISATNHSRLDATILATQEKPLSSDPDLRTGAGELPLIVADAEIAATRAGYGKRSDIPEGTRFVWHSNRVVQMNEALGDDGRVDTFTEPVRATRIELVRSNGSWKFAGVDRVDLTSPDETDRIIPA